MKCGVISGAMSPVHTVRGANSPDISDREGICNDVDLIDIFHNFF